MAQASPPTLLMPILLAPLSQDIQLPVPDTNHDEVSLSKLSRSQDILAQIEALYSSVSAAAGHGERTMLDLIVQRARAEVTDLQNAPVKVVDSFAHVDCALLREYAGICPELASLGKVNPLPAPGSAPDVDQALEDTFELVIPKYMVRMPQPGFILDASALYYILSAATHLVALRDPAPTWLADDDALPRAVTLAHPHAAPQRALRVPPSPLACAAVFQFAPAPGDAPPAFPAREPGEAPGGDAMRGLRVVQVMASHMLRVADAFEGRRAVRRVAVFVAAPVLQVPDGGEGEEEAAEGWVAPAAVRAAALLEATPGVKEVAFCVTDGVRWMPGYVAREEGQGGVVRCRYARAAVVGGDWLRRDRPMTAEKRNEGFREVLALACSLVDGNVPLEDLFV